MTNTKLANTKLYLLTVLWSALLSSSIIANESPYGICTHVSRRGEHDYARQNFKLMRQAGMTWARTDFDWTSVQSGKSGPWHFDLFDETVDWAESAGITILPILDYDVSWASPAYKHLDLWLEYVHQTVSRYKDRLKYWEVWNEQNLEGFWKEKPDPANYAILLKATYQEIKKIDPQLTVILGGVAGMPWEYLEGIYQAGGKEYFDAMAVHPYRYPTSPESGDLEPDLIKLKNLMARYHDQNKPVWVTEIGWPTHATRGLTQECLIKTGLEQVAPNHQKWRVAIFDDPSYPARFSFSDGQLAKLLPQDAIISRLNMNQLRNLSWPQFDILFWPSHEGIAVDAFNTIEKFVKDGGTLVLSHGVPLYYLFKQTESGTWQKSGAGEEYRQRLHIGWEAWWTKKGVAKEVNRLAVPEPFKDKIQLEKETPMSTRFLTAGKLKEGDRFIPLLTAANDSYEAPVAAVFDLNSDMKGAVIVSTLFIDHRGVSEQEQAVLMPRAYLIALHCGVEKMFWYNLRARENDPYYNEDHFGIIHHDLSPKPACLAMQALTQARPAGSTPTTTPWHNNERYYPSWKRPDGQIAWALWNYRSTEKTTLTIKGKIDRAFNHLGQNLTVEPINKKITITLSPNPIYIIGPETIEIK